ncbi:universal stress protein [Streptomyces sp. HPF1205]|uniref:universal stress protein n=1 Tax=Streptomyces sp. HPF1205 TaxID=2873262 RepID=UPI001CEC8936|nr:universal stress protein [Streptomyces sp. HPF1205]
MEPVVTVGLDGSPESLAAARWAADEAERRGLTLCLMHAWPMLAPEPAHVPAEVDQNYWARRTVLDARARIRADHPELTVIGNLIPDDACDALVRAASESELTVLGSRGLETVESWFLGDVSLPVVARAERPVVLVRAEAPGEGPSAAGSAEGRVGDVVVAVKLRAPCEELLGFAFAAAAARGVPLRAVHGRSVPLRAYTPWGVDHEVTEEVAGDARRRLADACRPWREKFPQVEIAENVGLESPARAVLRAAGGAALLVLGRRRRRPPLAPRLGPVTQAALHHARCPVAVVPHD